MDIEIEKIKQEYEEKQRKKKAKKKAKDDDKDKKKDDEDDGKAENERDDKVRSASLRAPRTFRSKLCQIKAIQAGADANQKLEDIPRMYALQK